jgi:hypothetical protein
MVEFEFEPYQEKAREKQIRHRKRLMKRMRNIITDWGRWTYLDCIHDGRPEVGNHLDWLVRRYWNHSQLRYYWGYHFERGEQFGDRRRWCKKKRSEYMSRTEYLAWKDARHQVKEFTAHKIRIK